jgi:acetyl-CoA carboxylase carboxyl transferase subunit beta
MKPSERIKLLADEGSFKEMYVELKSNDPLDFPGYKDKLKLNVEKTGKEDSVTAGVCKISGIRTAIAIMDSRFLMGSMGEKISVDNIFGKRRSKDAGGFIFTDADGKDVGSGGKL